MYIADLHCDTISKLYENSKDNTFGNLRSNKGHIDLQKLKEANYAVQNFALFVNKGQSDDAYKCFIKLYNLFIKEIDANKDIIEFAKSYKDIVNNMDTGKISAILTVEEGAVCGGDMNKLYELYEKGVRLMTITWNYPNELGFPNIDANKSKEFAKGSGKNLMTSDVCEFYRTPDVTNGLTDKGIQFVKEMQRIGMIVDVSHMSDAGFYDVYNNTDKPFTASHSNARRLSRWVRNLSNDMIKKLADRGGIIGLNFCADFVEEVPFGTVNKGNIKAIVDHAKHIVNLGGIECLGLGSDFDGIDTNEAIPNALHMKTLADEFYKGGFTSSEIEKIFYKNVLNFYKELL